MTTRKHILIINDESAILQQMRKWLADPEYSLNCTRYGRTGVKMASKTNYDLILIDYHLDREEEGAQTARTFIPQLHRYNPHTPIVVTSATENNLSAENLGVSKVVTIDCTFWKQLPELVKNVMTTK